MVHSPDTLLNLVEVAMKLIHDKSDFDYYNNAHISYIEEYLLHFYSRADFKSRQYAVLTAMEILNADHLTPKNGPIEEVEDYMIKKYLNFS